MVCAYEQRHAKRTDVSWPVSVWHPKALRFFNGRSMNVSSTGVLLSLPMKIPLRAGENVEINFPRSENLARIKGSCARIKSAKVIRIDRSDSLHDAVVKVGLCFENGSDVPAEQQLSNAE